MPPPLFAVAPCPRSVGHSSAVPGLGVRCAREAAGREGAARAGEEGREGEGAARAGEEGRDGRARTGQEGRGGEGAARTGEEGPAARCRPGRRGRPRRRRRDSRPPVVAGAPPQSANGNARRAARARAAARRRAATARRARRLRAERRASVVAPAAAQPWARPRPWSPPARLPLRPPKSGSSLGRTATGSPHRSCPFGAGDEPPQPLRVVRDIVEVVPTPLRLLVAGLVALLVLLAVANGLTLLRNRRLAMQRKLLLHRPGAPLQAALPPSCRTASDRAGRRWPTGRPTGRAQGGDFYDVLPLAGGQTAILIGDVSGHGRAALARTALARYALRVRGRRPRAPRGAPDRRVGAGGQAPGRLRDRVDRRPRRGGRDAHLRHSGIRRQSSVSGTPFSRCSWPVRLRFGVGAGTGQPTDDAALPARRGRMRLHRRAHRGARRRRPARAGASSSPWSASWAPTSRRSR